MVVGVGEVGDGDSGCCRLMGLGRFLFAVVGRTCFVVFGLY